MTQIKNILKKIDSECKADKVFLQAQMDITGMNSRFTNCLKRFQQKTPILITNNNNVTVNLS